MRVRFEHDHADERGPVTGRFQAGLVYDVPPGQAYALAREGHVVFAPDVLRVERPIPLLSPTVPTPAAETGSQGRAPLDPNAAAPDDAHDMEVDMRSRNPHAEPKAPAPEGKALDEAPENKGLPGAAGKKARKAPSGK